MPIILDVILPLNETRHRVPLIQAEFFIDEQKYFFSILAFSCVVAVYGIIPVLGTDSFYMSCVYHACGMLKILRLVKDFISCSYLCYFLTFDSTQNIYYF